MELIGAKVPPEVKQATKAEAERVGMSMSEYIRYQLRKLTDTEPTPLNELEGGDKKEAAA